MFTLKAPVSKSYMDNGKTCVINQLFGENKNLLFYGPEGHTGIDFRTTGVLKYVRGNGVFTPIKRESQEVDGRIQILACHDGDLTTILNDDKQGKGWGVFLTGDVLREDGSDVQYRTLYWHIETPWSSLGAFMGVIKRALTRTRVRQGSVIAIGGNNGMSTGPHLHVSLDRREKNNLGGWSAWNRINPMPYFSDYEVLYHKYELHEPQWFFQGKEITREEADTILKTLTPVV